MRVSKQLVKEEKIVSFSKSPKYLVYIIRKGGTSLYELHRLVLPQRILFLSRIGMDFDQFGHRMLMIFMF